MNTGVDKRFNRRVWKYSTEFVIDCFKIKTMRQLVCTISKNSVWNQITTFLFSEFPSNLRSAQSGNIATTGVLDSGAFIWWNWILSMAILWREWWWLSKTIQPPRSKWAVSTRNRWSNHLFNRILQSSAIGKWWSMFRLNINTSQF